MTIERIRSADTTNPPTRRETVAGWLFRSGNRSGCELRPGSSGTEDPIAIPSHPDGRPRRTSSPCLYSRAGPRSYGTCCASSTRFASLPGPVRLPPLLRLPPPLHLLETSVAAHACALSLTLLPDPAYCSLILLQALPPLWFVEEFLRITLADYIFHI
jgi:hypothetical protein